MNRIRLQPRKNWQAHVESLGFSFHSIDNLVYWNEGVCYRLNPYEKEEIEKATNEIHKLCMALVDNIVIYQRYHELGIPEYAWPLLEMSWKKFNKTHMGRLDLSFNGIEPPKLLEYNGDSSINFLEAGLVQKQWLNHVFPHCSQFNSLHESLVESWSQSHFKQSHLACRMEFPEMLDNINYLAKTMNEAGIATKLTHIDKIRWNGCNFVDEDDAVITVLCKLFPWEWMNEEVFNRVMSCGINIIEPVWKMILNNKGMMVLLWEMFPGHPNLLPTYFDAKKLSGDFVVKPIYGRSGEGVKLQTNINDQNLEDFDEYGLNIYQQVHLPAKIDDRYTVLGSWIIDGKSAGIGVREDTTPILHYNSHFVPHFID